MKISVTLRNLSNVEVGFLKQIGVEFVDLYPQAVPECSELRVDLAKVAEAVDWVRRRGLKIAMFHSATVRDALLGKPKGEKQVKSVCQLIRLLGEKSVPVVQVPLEHIRHGPNGVPGRYLKVQGERGYRMQAFSLDLMRRQLAERDLKSPWAHHFRDCLTFEEYFNRCVKVLKRIVPIAEESGVKVVLHTDDPPVPDEEGLLPGLTNPTVIDRVFKLVPSKSLGLLFCCGTRYESGLDVYEQIRFFAGKIFHVHLRNVRGTIPKDGGYDEVMIDHGDMDVFKLLKTLKNVGYHGALNPDHYPILIGDPEGRASVAFTVGYLKALLSLLEQ